jgi:hypothetical protein
MMCFACFYLLELLRAHSFFIPSANAWCLWRPELEMGIMFTLYDLLCIVIVPLTLNVIFVRCYRYLVKSAHFLAGTDLW